MMRRAIGRPRCLRVTKRKPTQQDATAVRSASKASLYRRIGSRLRRWCDAVRDSVHVAAIRWRARSAARSARWTGDVAAAPQVHGLFLYHQANAATERHFARLVAETRGLVHWHRLYNPGGGAEPQTDLALGHPALLMPRRFAAFARNPGGVQGGFADVAILPAVLATGAAFVWVMEYDVEFSGDWGTFFSQFQRNHADFLSTSLTSQREIRKWFHWPTARAPAGVHRLWRFRAFNPLMRLSRRFALGYVAALRDPDWRGHYEFTLPTIAIANGFTVEDIGGTSRFCPRDRRGRHYTATPDGQTGSPGSFVWRPAIPGYFRDRPELFAGRDLLYHPCKTDVPLWEEAGVAAPRRDGPEARPDPRVAVVMATCDGADYLGAQLASLARQTRLPDALIIGDDASTDATVAILRAFAATAPFPVTLVERTVRLGYSGNFIDLAGRAEADLILFCDQDDIWHDDKIAVVTQAARVTDADVYAHDLEILTDDRARSAPRMASYFDHLRRLGLPPDLCGKGCCLAVRPDFIRHLGWPPAASGLSHDAWIALLGTALGRRALIDAPLIRHRIHDRNASGWIISEAETAEKAQAPLDQTFAVMLDFYLGDGKPAWRDALLGCLETRGAALDPVRARAACDSLKRPA